MGCCRPGNFGNPVLAVFLPARLVVMAYHLLAGSTLGCGAQVVVDPAFYIVSHPLVTLLSGSVFANTGTRRPSVSSLSSNPTIPRRQDGRIRVAPSRARYHKANMPLESAGKLENSLQNEGKMRLQCGFPSRWCCCYLLLSQI